jgi:hypothetical protein
MAISPLWPKPPRWWPQQGLCHPGHRWVWHTRPRFILPLWEHVSAGAAQRYVRLAQTRRGARVWQLNTGALPLRTRYGPGVFIPTTDGAEIEALAGSSPNFAAWETNERYTIALLLKGRSGGASTKHLYRSGSGSTGDHMMWLASGTTPNVRHDDSGGSSVSIASSVAIVNDTTWSTLVVTWRPGRLELYVDGFSRANSTAAQTNTSNLFGIYRWGWGFSTNQDFNGDIALIACFASSWTPAMVRRWHADPFGFLRPWNEVPALFGSEPPATPPSTGTGVVTFLMG